MMERRLAVTTGTAENGAQIIARDSGMIGHVHLTIAQWTPVGTSHAYAHMTPGETRELAAELLALATRAEKLKAERAS